MCDIVNMTLSVVWLVSMLVLVIEGMVDEYWRLNRLEGR